MAYNFLYLTPSILVGWDISVILNGVKPREKIFFILVP
jgi:hypothetical protein